MNNRIRETEILTELTFGKVWLLWSEEHLAFWSTDERGYVDDIEKAGRYTFDEAVKIAINDDEQLLPAPDQYKLREELAEIAKTKGE